MINTKPCKNCGAFRDVGGFCFDCWRMAVVGAAVTAAIIVAALVLVSLAWAGGCQ